jgi:hypothetical protein
MSAVPVSLAVPVPTTAVAPVAPAAIPALEATDLERLRSLLQQTAAQTANPNSGLPAPGAVTEVAAEGARSFGDSILQGMMSFRSEYQDSVKSINQRLVGVSQNEMAGLNNFSEILSLQVDIGKWSMSVMGVDNATKAGTNTIKELSRG